MAARPTGRKVAHRSTHCTAMFVYVLALFGSSVAASADSACQIVNPGAAQRLRRLEDVESIRALLEHYIDLNQSRDYAAYSMLFATNGELVLRAGRATGPAAIRSMLEREFGGANAARGPAAGSSHLLSNIQITVTGDTAVATSRWTLLVPGDGPAIRVGGTGRYGDKLVRENAEWKFQQRIVYRDIPADPPIETAPDGSRSTPHR